MLLVLVVAGTGADDWDGFVEYVLNGFNFHVQNVKCIWLKYFKI